MNDIRKFLHIAYKKKMVAILCQYTHDFGEALEEFGENPEQWIVDWVNSNCLPMGDFSKEEVLKEIDGWQESD